MSDLDSFVRAIVREIVREELANAGVGCRAVSVADAARRLGIGRSALYEAIARGEIASVKVGRRRVVPEAEVARILGGRASDQGLARQERRIP
jgi:excisionase family DNA binding protein